MIMKLVTVLFILSFGLISLANCADSTGRCSIGVFVDYSRNYHTADFRRISDCPSCSPGYRDGSGNAFSFGLIFELPLRKALSIGVRASYTDLSAVLKSEEPTMISVDGRAVSGAFEHSFDAKLATIGIEPFAKYNIFENFYASAGFSAGYLVKHDYSQKEQITKPSASGTFLDEFGNDSHSRIRNVFSGQISNANKLNISPFIGISYRMPLSKGSSWHIEPELCYYLGLSNIVSDDYVGEWKSNSIRVGVSIVYSPAPPKKRTKEYENIWKIDTIRKESRLIAASYISRGAETRDSVVSETESQTKVSHLISRTDTLFYPKLFKLQASLSVVGINSFGGDVSEARLSIEEFVTNRYLPLLTYLFFGENSSEIDPRYVLLKPDSAASFAEISLINSSAMNVYYNMLNVIGSRLRANPTSGIRLVGCNDGYSVEKNRTDLSGARATAVKKYLTDVWGIDGKRIKVEKRNEPEMASVPLSDAEKMEENRRVEIYSTNYDIIKPVFLTDTTRKPSLLAMRFIPEVQSDAPLAKWQINVMAKGKIIREFLFSEAKERAVDLVLENDPATLEKIAEPFTVNLDVVDSLNQFFATPQQEIPLKIVTINDKRLENGTDKEINKFNLILFDFDKFDIKGNNSKIIQMIKEGIKPNSIVKINGYTDRTGDDEYNLELSKKRVSAVAKSLMITPAEAKGLGEKVLLFDNELPEGRFYCRTVEITIETPNK